MATFPPGRAAPEFSVLDQRRRERRLQDFRGDRLVLFFFRGVDDPASEEAVKAFRDREARFRARGVQVVGVSGDDVERHRAFADRLEIGFPLLADVDRAVMRRYGVAGNTGDARRVTFLISAEGVVERVYDVVDPAAGPDRILQDVGFFEHIGSPA